MLVERLAWLLASCGLVSACGGSAFSEAAAGSGQGGNAPTSTDTGNGGAATTLPGTGGAETSSGGGSGATGTAGSGGGGAGSGGPSITIVQATDIQITGTLDTPSIELDEPPTEGNSIIVAVTCFSEVENCTIPEGGVTDEQGNEYSRVVEGDTIASSGEHGARGYIFIAENISAPDGTLAITVDAIGSIATNYQSFAWGAIEVSGLLASNSVDATGKTAALCCDPFTTVATSSPTEQANELAVAVHTMRSNDDDVSYGFDPTWTQHHVNVNGAAEAMPHSMVTKILSSTELVEHTWTHDPPTRGVSAIVATFRGQSAGP